MSRLPGGHFAALGCELASLHNLMAEGTSGDSGDSQVAQNLLERPPRSAAGASPESGLKQD